MRFLLKWLDLPPIWLAFFGVTAWGQSRLLPAFSFGKWADWVGTALVGAGVLIAVSAILQFFGNRTSVIPRRTPRTLIRTGIYRLTRNPIYLADAMVLGGLILRWDAVLSVVLVPVFMAVIHRRFIKGEEMRIREEFGEAFDAYASRVRRWL
ncbi:methyltransferase family protein [Actibacterium lipolyticum]|nr:isoprenylcysteine carboxylmethyltransferase family protein [Actibacterium lipolyticum]